jgi:hypothetical protein
VDRLEEPPSDELERAVCENIMSYRLRRKNMIEINTALIGVYGSFIAAGGGDSTDIDDLIKEISQGF